MLIFLQIPEQVGGRSSVWVDKGFVDILLDKNVSCFIPVNSVMGYNEDVLRCYLKNIRNDTSCHGFPRMITLIRQNSPNLGDDAGVCPEV